MSNGNPAINAYYLTGSKDAWPLEELYEAGYRGLEVPADCRDPGAGWRTDADRLGMPVVYVDALPWLTPYLTGSLHDNVSWRRRASGEGTESWSRVGWMGTGTGALLLLLQLRRMFLCLRIHPVGMVMSVSYPSVTLWASLTVGDCSNWCYYAMEASACMVRVRMLRSGGSWATSP